MTLYYDIFQTNMKTDILSKKDQVDTMEDNKNVKVFKDKL